MKKISFLYVVAIFIFDGCHTVWKSFDYPDGRFSIDLPDDPVHQTQILDLSFGPMKVQQYLLTSYGITYGFRYMDFPKPMLSISSDKFLDETVKGFTNHTENVVKRITHDSYKGYPGRRVELYLKPNHVGCRYRLYLVGQRLYYFSLCAPQLDKKREDEDHFSIPSN